MSDEPSTSGWLPPQAPGGQPAPQFETTPPEPDPEPDADPPPATQFGDRPIIFQTPARQGNGPATMALVLGILGVVLLLFTAGLAFLFSLPMSIAAWIMGAQGRKNVAAGKTTYGDGIAHAGVILGIVGVVLGIVGMAVWLVLILSGVDLEELRRDLERRSDPDLDQAVWWAAQTVFGR